MEARESREKGRYKMARLDRHDIHSLYDERTGKCTHTNDADIWGIGFETELGHLFIYSVPAGGLFCQDWHGDVHQMEGTCQFSGKTSQAVKRYMDKDD